MNRRKRKFTKDRGILAALQQQTRASSSGGGSGPGPQDPMPYFTQGTGSTNSGDNSSPFPNGITAATYAGWATDVAFITQYRARGTADLVGNEPNDFPSAGQAFIVDIEGTKDIAA